MDENGGITAFLISLVYRLAMFAAIPVVLVFLVFSLGGLLQSSPTARLENSTLPVTPSATVSRLPFVFDGPTKAPGSDFFLVFLMCEGEEVASAIYGGDITVSYVALQSETDHDLIAAFLGGRATILPAATHTLQSACFGERLRDGVFP